MNEFRSLIDHVIVDVYISALDGYERLLTLEMVDGTYVSVQVPHFLYDSIDSYDGYWSDYDYELANEELKRVLDDLDDYRFEDDLPF